MLLRRIRPAQDLIGSPLRGPHAPLPRERVRAWAQSGRSWVKPGAKDAEITWEGKAPARLRYHQLASAIPLTPSHMPWRRHARSRDCSEARSHADRRAGVARWRDRGGVLLEQTPSLPHRSGTCGDRSRSRVFWKSRDGSRPRRCFARRPHRKPRKSRPGRPRLQDVPALGERGGSRRSGRGVVTGTPGQAARRAVPTSSDRHRERSTSNRRS